MPTIESVSPTRTLVRVGDRVLLVVDDLEGDELAAAIASETTGRAA